VGKISDYIDVKSVYSFAGHEMPGESVIESLCQNDTDTMPSDWSWHSEYSILCDERMGAVNVE